MLRLRRLRLGLRRDRLDGRLLDPWPRSTPGSFRRNRRSCRCSCSETRTWSRRSRGAPLTACCPHPAGALRRADRPHARGPAKRARIVASERQSGRAPVTRRRSRSDGARGPAWRSPRARPGRLDETLAGSLTRTLTNRSDEPPAGSEAPGSCDHAVAPGSAISTSPPVNTATCAARPPTVPRIRKRSTAEATNARRRSMGHVSSSAAPVQRPSHSRKSSGARAGSRYAGKQSSTCTTPASTSSKADVRRCVMSSSR